MREHVYRPKNLFCLREGAHYRIFLQRKFALCCFDIVVPDLHRIQYAFILVFSGLSVNGAPAILVNNRITVFDFFHDLFSAKKRAGHKNLHAAIRWHHVYISVTHSKSSNMRSFLPVIVMVCLIGLTATAQQNPSRNVDKSKRPTHEPSGNPGDARNARAASRQDSVRTQDPAQDAGDEELLGNDNGKAGRPNSNERSNYRNNRVNGNPNNRNTGEGSNRRSVQETSESSMSDDDQAAEKSGAVRKSNTGSSSISDVSTSGSGSPAMLSDEEGSERDGTNNVQRAEPNMAGSRVDGLRSRRQVDPDREIRGGAIRQQKARKVFPGAGRSVPSATEQKARPGKEIGSHINETKGQPEKEKRSARKKRKNRD